MKLLWLKSIKIFGVLHLIITGHWNCCKFCFICFSIEAEFAKISKSGFLILCSYSHHIHALLPNITHTHSTFISQRQQNNWQKCKFPSFVFPTSDLHYTDLDVTQCLSNKWEASLFLHEAIFSYSAFYIFPRSLKISKSVAFIKYISQSLLQHWRRVKPMNC